MAQAKRAPRRRKRADDVELASLPLPSPTDENDSGAMLIEPTASDIRANRELDDILSDIGGGDIKVRVARRSETGRMLACGELPGDTFSVESLADAFGGGDYLLRFMRGREEVERTTVEIDPLIPPRNPRAPRVVGGVAPTQNTGDMAAVMGSVVTMMATVMTSQMQASQAMMTGMSEMMRARPVETNPVDTLVKMAEVLRPATNATPASELLGVFEKGMSIARKMNGDGDGDGVLPIVAEAARAVTSIVQSGAEERRANAEATRQTLRETRASAASVVASQSPVAVVPAETPSPRTDIVSTTYRPWIAAALSYKSALTMMAGKVKPDNAAGMIVDVLTDDQLGDLLSDISGDPAEDVVVLPSVDILSAFASRTRAVFGLGDDLQQWTVDLAMSVLDQTEEESPPQDDGDGDTTTRGA